MKDHSVFDVSLVAGHRDYLDRRSDFSTLFVRRLTAAAKESKHLVPSLKPCPAGKLHFTLRAIYGNRHPEFKKWVPSFQRNIRYSDILRWLSSKPQKKRKIIWRRFVLMPGGELLLQGKAMGSWLALLRRRIDRSADRRPPYPASDFCHIVLARPTRHLRKEERRRLETWIRAEAKFETVEMEIKNPVLLATRNHFGTRYDLSENQRISARLA